MDKALEILNQSELHKIPNEIPKSKEGNESFIAMFEFSTYLPLGNFGKQP